MNLKFSIFALLLVLLDGRLGCSQGCLTCTTNSENKKVCSFCDIFNYFKPDGKGGCTRIVSAGCLVPSYDFSYNTCSKCQPGMIYDQSQYKCVRPSYTMAQKRCDEYGFNDECQTCQSGYYPDADGEIGPGSNYKANVKRSARGFLFAATTPRPPPAKSANRATLWTTLRSAQ